MFGCIQKYKHGRQISYFIYLFNVHRYETCEIKIAKGNSMPIRGDNSTIVASTQITFPIANY